MNIQALNTKTVTDALVSLLSNWPAIADGGVTVDSNEPINKSNDKCPWVGIYQTSHSFDLRTLGMGMGFRMQRLELAIVMTESSSISGANCEERMEKLIADVVSAILSDSSIGGTMNVTVDPFRVTYSDYRNEGNAFFKEAVLQVTLENAVSVT